MSAHPAQNQTYDQMLQCAEACLRCRKSCLDALHHLMEQTDGFKDPALVRMLTDCSEACLTGANFLQRGSQLYGYATRAVAEIGQICAQWCERSPQDTALAECARQCRSTVAACRRMAGSILAGG